MFYLSVTCVVEEKIVFIQKNVRNKHFVPKNQNQKKKNENVGKRNNKKVQGHQVKTIYKNNKFNMPKNKLTKKSNAV